MEAETMADTELLTRARDGETACYGVLVTRHHRRMYRAAQKILRNDADAEDATQEAYLHSFRRLDQFEGRSAVVTWLARIAVNEAFTLVRRRVPWDSLDAPGSVAGDRNLVEFLAAPIRDPEQQAISRETENRFRAAVAALPEAYSAAFRLREIEGLTTEETVARLGITRNCLKMRLFRARSLLRAHLECLFGTWRLGDTESTSGEEQGYGSHIQGPHEDSRNGAAGWNIRLQAGGFRSGSKHRTGVQ